MPIQQMPTDFDFTSSILRINVSAPSMVPMTFIRSQTLTKLSTRSIVPSVWNTGTDLAIADSKLTVGAVFAYVRGLLGIIFLKRGQPALAATKFRELIKLSPQNDLGYTGLGRVLTLQREYSAAEEQFKQAIALKSKTNAHFYWGQMLVAKGDHVAAIKKYEEALAMDPKWDEPYAAWGESLRAQGNAEVAKEKFTKALDLEPKHPDFQKYKAVSK